MRAVCLSLLSIANRHRRDISRHNILSNDPAMRREYLPIEALPVWQRLNGIVATGIEFQKLGFGEHGADKGSAIVATEAKSSSDNDLKPEILLRIPNTLVLSLEAVQNHAKSDHHLRDVLGAVGDFGRVRGSVYLREGETN